MKTCLTSVKNGSTLKVLILNTLLFSAQTLFTAASEREDATESKVHRVVKGDTLQKLSRRYGVTVPELRSANGLKGDLIRIGQTVKIPDQSSATPQANATKTPDPEYHTVKRGEFLAKIAEHYRVTVKQLMTWNGLKSTLIHPGLRLRVVAPKQHPKAPELSPDRSPNPDGPVPEGPAPRLAPPKVPIPDGQDTDQAPEKPDSIPVAGPVPDENEREKRKTHVELELLTHEDRVRVQIFLDDAMFRPGKVDGSLGEFTDKAAERWKQAQGFGGECGIDRVLQQARKAFPDVFQSYRISDGDLRHVGKVAASIPDKAKQKALPYASLSEMIAEKFHTDERMLQRLNPTVALNGLAVGDHITVPSVRHPFSFPGDVPVSARGPRENFISIVWPDKVLEVRDKNGKLVASFPVTLGGQAGHVRSGDWQVANFVAHPTFRWDASVLRQGVRSDHYHLLPPGPNNLVGVAWMGLSRPDGKASHIGIHGTNQPETIGRAESSGCIRLANWDIVELSELVQVGCSVRWCRFSEPAS
jgi:LysM repeat protein/lipoprotein-anchoring transpeptidase ErfK/SrfK